MGVPRENAISLYLEDIARCDQSDEDLKLMIRSYGKERGLRIMATEIIKNRYCDDVVGCKIKVPESQEQKAISGYFWPEDVLCRRWIDYRGKGHRYHKRS